MDESVSFHFLMLFFGRARYLFQLSCLLAAISTLAISYICLPLAGVHAIAWYIYSVPYPTIYRYVVCISFDRALVSFFVFAF